MSTTHIQDVKCTAKVLSGIHKDLLFPIAKQIVLLAIIVVWIIYGTVKKRWKGVLPYPIYHPQSSNSDAQSTLYFVRIFYSQATAQFSLNRTRLKIQLGYTDRTFIIVETQPEVLQSSLKYKNDSCCNFFIRSGNHVGQLDSVLISHDSGGTFFVEFVEIQRLDNDPKQQFLAEIGENILPERAAKPKKFSFEKPKDIEPDNDARPVSTITLFEMIPFFVLTIQVGSLITLVLIEYSCTDADAGGCSRFSLLAIGSAVGVVVFFVWMIILYFYINVIRKGLFNNLGLDYCNYFRLAALIVLVGAIVQIAFEIVKASYSYKFGKVNAGSNVLNCDQSYALTSVTAFFLFYILFGIMAPLYIIHRANYELLLATLEEQRKNDKPPPKSKNVPIESIVDDTMGTSIKVKDSPISTVTNLPPSTKSFTPLAINKAPPPTKKVAPVSNTKYAFAAMGKNFAPTKSTTVDNENNAGYAAQMMKLNKVKSISQYVLKKK